RGKTGLPGESINVETGEWTNRNSHIGGCIDSYFEYLIKCDKLLDDKDCAAMSRESLAAIDRHIADETGGALWYAVVDMNTGRRTATTYGALHAFFPAVLALHGDLDRARRL